MESPIVDSEFTDYLLYVGYNDEHWSIAQNKTNRLPALGKPKSGGATHYINYHTKSYGK